MTVVVSVPSDSAAVALGADEVVAALVRESASRGADVRVVRTGSRGMLWLEPLLEVRTDVGRLGYGPVTAADVPALLDAGMLATAGPDGAAHPLALGRVDDLPWLASQQRLVLARLGVVDPLDPADHEAHGGLAGLRAALSRDPADVVEEVVASGLRGRGGAGFPTGVKWRTVAAADADLRYVVCNADEGDSGSFADRMVLEGDPFTLLEGMAIAGLAVGAERGIVYVRSEYPLAIAALREAVARAREAGWLGPDILGSGRVFDVSVRVGAGSYVCGEETAMLESLEGLRGVVRPKPPIPALAGLFGRPTVVNNVLTLAAVPSVLAGGAAAHAELGHDRSRGTQVVQLAGNVARGGLVEVPFGITLRELVEGYGGGTRSGRPVKAVQVGGPLGSYLRADDLDVPLDYEGLHEVGAMLGHGGVVVFDDTADMSFLARFAMDFCAAESCGRCTPCRIGSVRGVELLDGIRAGDDVDRRLALLDDLCEVMESGSLCAMGSLTPQPVRSAVRSFPEDFLR